MLFYPIINKGKEYLQRAEIFFLNNLYIALFSKKMDF